MSQNYLDFIMLAEPALVWLTGMAIAILLAIEIKKKPTYPLVVLEVGAIVCMLLFTVFCFMHLQYYSIFRFDGTQWTLQEHEIKSLTATALTYQKVFVGLTLGNLLVFALIRVVYRNRKKVERQCFQREMAENADA